MRLFLTGSTGLIGHRLVHDRIERGDEIVLLTRDVQRASHVFDATQTRISTFVEGDPARPGSWQNALSGCDAVIHLAGAGLTDRRWSAAYKQTLQASRIDSSREVVSAIDKSSDRPAVLVSASGIGYYGDRGDEELTEESSPGNDFLAQLCQAWETQAAEAERLGTRVVMLRIAPVLDARGGALRKMILPFKLFAGGPLGSGRQFFPWVHWRDLIGLINHALDHQRLRGPINAVAPQQIRQREFARALGRALGRPAFMPTPRLLLRLALGDVASSLLASQRAVPRKALESSYEFAFPNVEEALQALITEGLNAS